MSDVVYLYGFVPAGTLAPPQELAGIGAAPVTLLELGPVNAAVSLLPATDFDAASVEARLQDVAWVGEQGLAHERVVLWFVDHHRILPARLFSLYTSADALRQALESQAGRLAGMLADLGDRREWNLKVACDPGEMARHAPEVSEQVAALDAEIATAPPGRRYLMQRQRTDLVRDEVGRAGRRLADELLAELGAHADEVRTLPLASVDAEAGTVLLNAALLVRRDREQDLQTAAEAAVARLRPLGVRASFSGPWAAYRFLEEGPQ
ncbi:MAG TPA: GvpL/GvpF family gas vesicle protein [Longimicrobiales bacterium]|nr:GvpL/GvpF family gas vesicle protein [Longimicrobiales bacterium]